MSEMTGFEENNEHQQQVPPSEMIESVRELIAMMSRGGISELDLTTGDVSIRLRGQSATLAAPAPAQTNAPVASATGFEEPEGNIIASPMIGTFYGAPSPGEAPFVKIGDEIEVGQVIGIIEAMKIMNEIAADRSGIVVELIAGDGQTVEYGSALIRIEPATV